MDTKGLKLDDMLKCMYSILFGAIGAAQASSMAGDTAEGNKAAIKIYKTLDKETKIMGHTGSNNRMENSVKGHIEFKNVWFKYPTRKEYIYQGISFVIQPGQSVAFCGPSGCGKSTCIQLLLRFYNIHRGEILLDGVNINDIP